MAGDRAKELEQTADKLAQELKELSGAVSQFERVYPVVNDDGENPYAHIKPPAARLIAGTCFLLSRERSVSV